jgi:hypothetical protein
MFSKHITISVYQPQSQARRNQEQLLRQINHVGLNCRTHSGDKRWHRGLVLWFFFDFTVISYSLKDNPVFQKYQGKYEGHRVV